MAGDMFDAVPMVGGGLGAQASGPRMGIEGGEVRNGVGGTAGKDWFQDGMDIGGGNLPEFLNEAFAPALQAAKEERMWDGFVKAREGATMQEITADQPWYTRMFGPTDYELGASMYTVQKQVSDMESDVLARMPELRKLDSAAMGKELNRLSQSAQTGNAFTDSLLRKQLMDRAGPVMDLHTKERVAWQQGELVRVQTEAIGSAGTALNNMMIANAKLGKDKPLDQSALDSLQQVKASFFDTLRTSQYQTDGSIKEVYTAAIRGMVDRGEFYAVNTLVDAGVLSAMDVEDAQKMEKYIDAGQMRFRQRWQSSPEVVEEIARLNAEQAWGIGGKATMDHALAISNQFVAETGSRVPLWDADEIGRFSGQSMSNYIRRRERADDKAAAAQAKIDDAAAKEEAKARNAADGAKAWVSGAWGRAVDMSDVERKDMERYALSAHEELMAKGDIKTAMGLLVFNQSTNRGKVVGLIADGLQGDLRNTLDEQVTTAFMGQYAIWKALNESPGFKEVNGRMERVDSSAGPTTALAYYGAELDSRMRQFDGAVSRSGMQPDLAYRMAFGNAAHDKNGDLRGLDSAQTKENTAAVRTQVDALDAGIFNRSFRDGQRLHPSTKAVVSAQAAYWWGTLPGEMDAEDRARNAVHLAKTQGGLEIAGRWGWANNKGQQSLGAYMGDATGEESGIILDQLIEQKLKESGSKSSKSVSIIRMPDVDGEPMLHVMAWDEDGVHDATLFGRDMQKAKRAYVQKKLDKTPETSFREAKGY